MKTVSILTVLLIGGLMFAACESNSTVTEVSPSPTVVASPTAMPRVATSTNSIENSDGSTTVVTTYSDGSKTEVRSFRTGKLASVSRTTDPSGARSVRVTYRADNSEVELDDDTWFDKAMDSTGDALATAGNKTKAAAVETADKAEDVGDAVKKGAKKAASETADKAEDVGDAVKKGTKKTVKKVKDVIKP